MNFDELLLQKTKETEDIIVSYLPKEEGNQKTVLEAMNYSVKVGGKDCVRFLWQRLTVCSVVRRRLSGRLWRRSR